MKIEMFLSSLNLFLHTNGAVQVHTASGTNTVIDLYWSASDPFGNLAKKRNYLIRVEMYVRCIRCLEISVVE